MCGEGSRSKLGSARILSCSTISALTRCQAYTRRSRPPAHGSSIFFSRLQMALVFEALEVIAERRAAQNLIIVLRVSVTLLVTPTGPPLARWNAAYCS
jgi:hypothetical protein